MSPQIGDTEVRKGMSALDWVIAQPVHLTDGQEDDKPFVSTTGEIALMKVSRTSVGRFLADAGQSPMFIHKSAAL